MLACKNLGVLHSAGALQGSIYGYEYLWASNRNNQTLAYGYCGPGNFYYGLFYRFISSAVLKLALLR